MRAMGIDPGTAICGFGVVDSDGSRLRPVTYGTIQTTPDRSDADRLVTIYEGLHELYEKYREENPELFIEKKKRKRSKIKAE